MLPVSNHVASAIQNSRWLVELRACAVGQLNMAVSTAGNSLLIKHFPQWLGREEKESLLQHFGAVDVVVMPTHGRMVCSNILIMNGSVRIVVGMISIPVR